MGRVGTSGAFVAVAALAASAAWGQSQTTAYDSLGRVVSVVTTDGKQTAYALDPAGNRASVATSAGAVLAPIAVNDAIAYTGGQPAPTFDPRVNDSDPGHLPLTIIGVGPPQLGSASFTATSVTYTPPSPTPLRPSTVDTFGYTIQNSAGATASALVIVTLTNPAPIANPDSVTAPEDGAVTFDPRLNDSDPGGHAFTVTAVTQPAHGGATIGAGGTSVTYTPMSGYWGQDAFGYTITNTVGLSASANVTATVTALPPTANPYAVGTATSTAVTFDPRVNDTDPNYLPLTITAVGMPAHGAAAINNGASVTYTPASGYTGGDSFSYGIANSGGGGASSTITATVGGPLAASVAPTAWHWRKFASGNVTVSPNAVVSVSGGQSPYTYAWQCLSGQCSGAAKATATAPAGASTAWTATVPQDNTAYTSLWQVTVTDHLGAVANPSPQVNVSFEWDNGN